MNGALYRTTHMRMIPLPDSKKPDFFCSGCQNHKKGDLLSHKIKNRKYCTTCSLPAEEREQMGIMSPYENTAKQRASVVQAAKAYKKPLNDQSLYAITGENNGPTKTT